MEQRISIERLEQAVNIFGSFDENIRLLEQEFSVTVVNRDGELRVEGEPEDTMLACKAIQALLTLSSRGEAIGEQNVRYVIGLVRSGKESQITELTGDVLCISAKGRPIKPKTIGQKEYIKSVLKNTVTIGVGPAGTGKTYLAVAAAVQAFRDKQVNRIILTRPAVEAGERLGFLPGDLQSKVDPYLRPLYDALFDMLHEKAGCIVNISSIWGLRGASCEVAYACTKAALVGLTRSLALELAPSHIRVNCVAPGVINTDMVQVLGQETLRDLAEQTPLGRLGTPEDVAHAVAFLASDKASFLTGQILAADGGFIV